MNKNNNATQKLAFIGGGNMAEAFIAGLIRAKAWSNTMMAVSDISDQRRSLLAERYDIQTFSDNAAAVANADVVILAVKPQIMQDAIPSLRSTMPSTALVISIAAGVPTTAIESWLNHDTRVIRVMPNTPALVGCGMHVWCRGKNANLKDAQTTQKLLETLGRAVEMPENMLDAATALSGSGPAYVFYLAEAMLQAGRDMGFSHEQARLLAAATIEGAGRMLTETNDDPAKLRQQVTSKGGTTAAAISVLDRTETRKSMIEAIRAAEIRARELSAAHASARPKP